MKFERGDIVTRFGGDEHRVLSTHYDWGLIKVKCIKEPVSGYVKKGHTEKNVPELYTFVRHRPEKKPKGLTLKDIEKSMELVKKHDPVGYAKRYHPTLQLSDEEVEYTRKIMKQQEEFARKHNPQKLLTLGDDE